MSLGLIAVDGTALFTVGAFGRQPAEWDMLLSVLIVTAFHATGLYRTRLTLSVLDDLPRLLGGVLFAALGATAMAAAAGFGSNVYPIFIQALLIALFVISGRAGAYAAIRWVRAAGWFVYPTLILGTGKVAARIADAIREHPEHGLRLVGFVDDHPRNVDALPAPVLGRTARLADVLKERQIAVVVVAFGGIRTHDLVRTLREGAGSGRQIFLVPRLFELSAGGQLDRIRAMPLYRLPHAAVRRVSWGAKRLFDIVVAGMAIVLLSPLLIATAIAVRIESGPDVLFRQHRVGLNGREFTLYKFRSVTPVDDEESRTRWTVADDDRIGPVGKFIRRTSIDELPQLFNVLRGDMSIVGPRPERPHFVKEFSSAIASYPARHRVPTGLTGWAAVNGLRGDTSIEERAHFDNFYIDNWSLWLDVKILIWTLPAVLRGHDG